MVLQNVKINFFRILQTFYRWSGIAKGVGTQRIIGRIHMVQLQIEKDYLASSFSVLEQQPMDMLLGLDMLKRHQVGFEEFALEFVGMCFKEYPI